MALGDIHLAIWADPVEHCLGSVTKIEIRSFAASVILTPMAGMEQLFREYPAGEVMQLAGVKFYGICRLECVKKSDGIASHEPWIYVVQLANAMGFIFQAIRHGWVVSSEETNEVPQ